MLTLRCTMRTLSFSNNINIAVIENLVKSVFNNSSKINKISTRCISESKVNINVKMNPENTLQMENIFRFSDYDCLGFDLDNTICRYKISKMVTMEYESMSNFLVNQKGYSAKHLRKPIEENLDFLLKGLILDVKRGNVLRIDPDGHILHGSHGTKEMTRSEIIDYYGEHARWNVTDQFTENPLITWNGPLSESMRTLLDYFDMPAGLIFARAVDTLDEVEGRKLTEYNIWPDVVDSLQDMFQRENFPLSKGGYFPNMIATPDEYIHQCSSKLMDWFKCLKAQKKVLFLITGSNVDFASHTAENSMGPNWRELFDIIICFAKKPGFFTEQRPFMALDGFTETSHIDVSQLEQGGIYTMGNWNGLYEFLKKLSKKEHPKIVYMGDNLIQDVYAPAVYTQADTVAVCEELEAEGAFGHDCSHLDQHFLVSNIWGSYFHHKEHDKSTIWKDIIKKHSKICIPSLEYVADYSIDYQFPTH